MPSRFSDSLSFVLIVVLDMCVLFGRTVKRLIEKYTKGRCHHPSPPPKEKDMFDLPFLPILSLKWERYFIIYFDIFLTVHLSIILVTDKLNAQILFFIISLLYSSTCFEHCCAHHHEVKLHYTASGIVTLCRWSSGVQVETGWYHILYNTIWPTDDEHNSIRDM